MFVTCACPSVIGAPVPGCSLAPPRPGTIHVTEGSVPSATAAKNDACGWIRSSWPVSRTSANPVSRFWGLAGPCASHSAFVSSGLRQSTSAA